ncbi:MAG: molybdopterin molybdotransferase MoeA, partial [Thermoleophilaceae bacterium]|nr:molybdopterin molybdotransferase MoeA [Thermoleophilaceae bacterium]
TGHDVRPAGDDISSGQTVVPAGSMIGAGELAMLAAIGMQKVPLRPLPRVAIVATGDELAVPGQQLQPGQIYDSNSYMLGQLVREAGAEVSNVDARVADNFDTVLSSINAGLEACDVLVICGGVSKGEHDHVKPALKAAGVEQKFWQVALRPGHPTWFGVKKHQEGKETLVFGLPGNPVSAYVTFQLFVRAAINGLVGADNAPLTLLAEYRGEPQAKKVGFTQALRCKLSNDGEKLVAQPTSNNQRSHALSSVVAADGLVLLPPESGGVTSGDSVAVQLV